jgi:hypothetical protein
MEDMKRSHHVYVVELASAVLSDRRFAAANPQRDPARPCVYVGLTGLHPEQRFQNHLDGVKSARLVRRYGLRLRPELYLALNPMSYDDARQMEIELANRLRCEGYAVWQN